MKIFQYGPINLLSDLLHKLPLGKYLFHQMFIQVVPSL